MIHSSRAVREAKQKLNPSAPGFFSGLSRAARFD
jgi:hypothetical protein